MTGATFLSYAGPFRGWELAMTASFMLAPFVKALGYQTVVIARDTSRCRFATPSAQAPRSSIVYLPRNLDKYSQWTGCTYIHQREDSQTSMSLPNHGALKMLYHSGVLSGMYSVPFHI